MQTLGKILSACALLSLMGGHWALLQIAAWSIMIVDRSDEVSVVDAVVETINGSKPCALCKTIQKAKKEEEKPHAILRGDIKIELFSSAPEQIVFAPVDTHLALTHSQVLNVPEWVIEPSVPVPILVG